MLNQRFLFILFWFLVFFPTTTVQKCKNIHGKSSIWQILAKNKTKRSFSPQTHFCTANIYRFHQHANVEIVCVFVSPQTQRPNKPSVLAVETERGHAGQEAAPC